MPACRYSDSSCRKTHTALSNSRASEFLVSLKCCVLEKLLTACHVGIFPCHRDHTAGRSELPYTYSILENLHAPSNKVAF